MGNNFLSDKAVQEVRQGLKEIRKLEAKLTRIAGTGPRGASPIYARLTAYDSTIQAYDATQVNWTGEDWTDAPTGRVWGGDSSEALAEIITIGRIDPDLVDEIHPVFRFNDGNIGAWGVMPQDPKIFATIDSTISDGTYAATQIEYSDAGDWTTKAGGLSWGDGTADVGTLIELNDIPEVPTSKRVRPFNNNGQWFFEYTILQAPDLPNYDSTIVQIPSADSAGLWHLLDASNCDGSAIVQ